MLDIEFEKMLNEMADEFIENIESGYFAKMILKNNGDPSIDEDAIENFSLWIEHI